MRTLPNERTFLAWIRTSLGIMAFGFVIEKFALFSKQFNLFLGKSQPFQVQLHSVKGNSIVGIILVAFGALICLFAFLKYKKVARQIEDNSYRPAMLLNILIVAAVLFIGVFLVIYLSRPFEGTP